MTGKPPRPVAVDLFAGAGGMSLGFEQAGFDIVAAVEMDPVHCSVHEYNFPFWTVICRSVTEISGDEIRAIAGLEGRPIDVVFGGPPCEGFSLMGRRALDDPRNALVGHFMRLVSELDASYFVMENVYGLTVGEHKKFLLEVMQEFESRGYAVVPRYQVLNAAHYGVPQDRRRLFLLGCRRGLTPPRYPEPTTTPATPLQDNGAELFDLDRGPTVWDAIGDLPEVERHEGLFHGDSVVYEESAQSPYARRMRGCEPDPKDYSYPRRHEPAIATSCMRTRHTAESIRRFRETAHGKTEPVSHFLKLDPNGISNTLRAGTPSNRGAFTSPRPIHPFTPRCITVREAARLHSYPDWFRFHKTKWHGFRQVGNSVPPLLARAVAQGVIAALGVRPTKPRGARRLGDEALLELNMSQAAERYGVHPHVIAPRRRVKA